MRLGPRLAWALAAMRSCPRPGASTSRAADETTAADDLRVCRLTIGSRSLASSIARARTSSSVTTAGRPSQQCPRARRGRLARWFRSGLRAERVVGHLRAGRRATAAAARAAGRGRASGARSTDRPCWARARASPSNWVIRSMRSGKGEQWWEDDHDCGGPQGEDRKVGGLPALEPVEPAASCEESGG
jgi:hypothetical protein